MLPTTPIDLRTYRESSGVTLEEVASAGNVSPVFVLSAEKCYEEALPPAAFVAAVQQARRQKREQILAEIKTLEGKRMCLLEDLERFNTAEDCSPCIHISP